MLQKFKMPPSLSTDLLVTTIENATKVQDAPSTLHWQSSLHKLGNAAKVQNAPLHSLTFVLFSIVVTRGSVKMPLHTPLTVFFTHIIRGSTCPGRGIQTAHINWSWSNILTWSLEVFKPYYLFQKSRHRGRCSSTLWHSSDLNLNMNPITIVQRDASTQCTTAYLLNEARKVHKRGNV